MAGLIPRVELDLDCKRHRGRRALSFEPQVTSAAVVVADTYRLFPLACDRTAQRRNLAGVIAGAIPTLARNIEGEVGKSGSKHWISGERMKRSRQLRLISPDAKRSHQRLELVSRGHAPVRVDRIQDRV